MASTECPNPIRIPMRPMVYGRDVVLQPAERIVRIDKVRQARPRRQVRTPNRERVNAPPDHKHDHHGGYVHDAQRLFAGFGDALDVFPPEVERHQNGEECRRRIHRKLDAGMKIGEHLVDQADQIQTGRDAADGSGQDVVEHQRGDRELRQGRAHRLFHHAVHTAAHKHAAAFDVERPDSEGEHHDRQNEPRRGFADEVFGDRSRIKRGRPHVVQHHGRGLPEGDECQHRRGSDQHARRARRCRLCSRLHDFLTRSLPT